MTKNHNLPQLNPSDAEILALVPPLVKDVSDLKQWRRDTEIAKSAVAEYVKDNPAPKTQQGSDQWLNRELVKTLGIALAVILALVELAVQLKGNIK